MAALTANRKRHTRNLANKRTLEIKGVDSDEFYEGGMVSYSAAASTLVPSSDTASERIAGVAIARTSTGASNTVKISVEWGHSEWFATAASSIAAGDEGKDAVVADDQTLSEAADESNDVPAGRIEEIETINGTAGAWITVGVLSGTNA
jgi:hypothetical protein